MPFFCGFEAVSVPINDNLITQCIEYTRKFGKRLVQGIIRCLTAATGIQVQIQKINF